MIDVAGRQMPRPLPVVRLIVADREGRRKQQANGGETEKTGQETRWNARHACTMVRDFVPSRQTASTCDECVRIESGGMPAMPRGTAATTADRRPSWWSGCPGGLPDAPSLWPLDLGGTRSSSPAPDGRPTRWIFRQKRSAF